MYVPSQRPARQNRLSRWGPSQSAAGRPSKPAATADIVNQSAVRSTDPGGGEPAMCGARPPGVEIPAGMSAGISPRCPPISVLGGWSSGTGAATAPLVRGVSVGGPLGANAARAVKPAGETCTEASTLHRTDY